MISMTRTASGVLALVSVSVWAASAWATCAFDEASGVLSVSPGGNVLSIGAGGQILLGGTACEGATTTTTARIAVSGSTSVRDYLQVRGKFAPGRDDGAETGLPEIEIEVTNFDGNDEELFVVGSGGADTWRFSAAGIDLNGDGDSDLTAPSDGLIRMKGLGGDDVIDASAYGGTADLLLRGGPGNDTITGGPGADNIQGEAGNDVIFGGAGADTIYHGLGADTVRGGPGNDRIHFDLSTAASGLGDEGDDFHGGSGVDEVSFIGRAIGIVVTLDHMADDGEPGEMDTVHPDIEWVTGGDGDDVLVGSDADDILDGGEGQNELHGGAGNDYLECGLDDGCLAFGEDGDDRLSGGLGPDTFDGGPGDDRLEGRGGSDTLDGGGGIDTYVGGGGNDIIFNADGLAETVDCGLGTDDPEPDPLDTFISCENI
jgi:Ca2+-binding RTX toxin-like protein